MCCTLPQRVSCFKLSYSSPSMNYKIILKALEYVLYVKSDKGHCEHL